MKKLYKNWTFHNLISHPLSEIVYLTTVLFLGRVKATNLAGVIHDFSIPEDRTLGRG